MAEIDALDEAEYTEGSWAEFQTVVAEAKEFKENATDETKQREIRQMISTLEERYGEPDLHPRADRRRNLLCRR